MHLVPVTRSLSMKWLVEQLNTVVFIVLGVFFSLNNTIV